MKDILFERMTLDYWERKLIGCKIKLLRPIYLKYIVPRKAKVLRKKNVINVLFVIHELASWKTENLYRKMKVHPRFNAQLLLLPATDNSYSFNILKEYLEKKNYSYNTIEKGESIKKKLHPDIIFYGKPYSGILYWKYFFSNNMYALFCYVVYSFRNRNSPHLRDIVFFDFIWQLYAENDKVIEEMYDVLNFRGANMINTGLSFMDELLLDKSHFEDPWKLMSNNKKRIIFAPHHTLQSDNGGFVSPFYYSTFLDYADFMLEMVEKYKDKVQWAFKPHPFLRTKLYKIWGVDKTDAYYKQWSDMENCQICEGDYMGLFKYSDAMIHDCGSFRLEYLYTDNPVMFLVNNNQDYDFQNWQTTKAMELHYKGTNKAVIEQFIKDVIDNKDPLKGERTAFVKTYLTPPNGKSASDNIINAILGEEEYSCC